MLLENIFVLLRKSLPDLLKMLVGTCTVTKLISTTRYISWRSFGHILVTLTIELQMVQALLTVESPVNTGIIWWARLDLNQRPLPCEGSALLTNSPKTL